MAIECPVCQFINPASTEYCRNCATSLPPSGHISSISTKTFNLLAKELTRGSIFASRYEVIEELGEGGMGRIFRVEDKKIKEEVALKLIKPEIASDKKTIERFSNELKYARKIAHRNVCRMYDLGEEKQTHYITMEYVPGEDLRSMIKMVGQLSAAQAVSIARQVSEGLAEAHRLGVVHRDLKSSNIMIDKAGNARIMDFGLARSLQAKGIPDAGMMVGTPEYISPEQVDGKDTDQRSDIYSLGVIIYEMMTGRLPFEGDSPLSIALKHKTERPPDPRKFNPQVTPELSRLILKCMEKERERRYQSAEELRTELTRIEGGMPQAEREAPSEKAVTLKALMGAVRKRWAMVAVLCAVVLVAASAFLYLGREGPVVPSSEVKMLVVLPFENLG
ncbi:MAG: serine/threonine protein kinase, partial [Candidatus Aminicenantaceae bacterium]